jgi:hypothetical protein
VAGSARRVCRAKIVPLAARRADPHESPLFAPARRPEVAEAPNSGSNFGGEERKPNESLALLTYRRARRFIDRLWADAIYRSLARRIIETPVDPPKLYLRREVGEVKAGP